MNYGIGEVQAIAGDLQPAASAGASGASPTDRFGAWFTHELGEVNEKLKGAEQGVQQLATGGATNLHDVMIRLEEARLSFQLAIQFRARVLESYQDVMRMQV